MCDVSALRFVRMKLALILVKTPRGEDMGGGGSGCIALGVDTKWRWVFSLTLPQLYPVRKELCVWCIEVGGLRWWFGCRRREKYLVPVGLEVRCPGFLFTLLNLSACRSSLCGQHRTLASLRTADAWPPYSHQVFPFYGLGAYNSALRPSPWPLSCCQAFLSLWTNKHKKRLSRGCDPDCGLSSRRSRVWVQTDDQVSLLSTCLPIVSLKQSQCYVAGAWEIPQAHRVSELCLRCLGNTRNPPCIRVFML
jgi:hypothetical protein